MNTASIRELFERALALSPTERARLLAEQTMAEDQRALLVRLLAAADGIDATGGGDPLARNPVQWSEDIGNANEHAARFEGSSVGPFRIQAMLGEGGSARVFRATRVIEGVVQTVALKVLRHGISSTHARLQFDRERHALVRLTHPGIAQLVDGGISDRGEAYIALEYVDGVPLTRYARDNALPLRERLRLMVEVAQAVAAAHRSLIVHRDIKPGNVLVTAGGNVKLLDFGIAKLLDPDPDSVEHTLTQFRAFTPAYAAPEQRVGGAITTATDVYALGVLLGELVTGERVTGADAGKDDDTVAGAPRRTRRWLRGDLDNILQKATAFAPEQRYDGAAAFADDLERLLAGQPVRAHPPSNWYRARKFVARHRGGVSVATLLLAGMIGSLLFALWQARIARDQAGRAMEVQAFIESLFEPIEQGRAQPALTVADLVQRGVDRVEASHPEHPALRADLLALFARLNTSLGETQRNRALSLAAMHANIEAYGSLDERSLDARFVHGQVLRRLGEYDAALAVFDAALRDLRADRRHGFEVARVLDAVSVIRMEQGIGGDEAIALKLEMMRERERDPALTDEDRATGYNNVGVAYQYAGDFAAALDWYGKGLAINQRIRPDSRATAVSLLNIGMVEGYRGRWREAAAMLEQARERFARIGVDRHPSLVGVLTQLCAVDGELERFERSAERCDQAVAMARAVHGDSHTAYLLALARRAGIAFASGRIADGDADLATARAVLERFSGDRDYNGAILDTIAARRQRALGDYAGLRETMLGVLFGAGGRPSSRVHGASPGEMGHTALLALACAHAPSAACAGHDVAEVRALLLSPRFSVSAQRLSVRNTLARIELLQQRPQAAIEWLATAPEDFRDALGAGHSRIAEAHLLLAAAHAATGDDAGAARHRALAEDILATLPPALAELLRND